jgi:antitoxin YefM
MKTANFTEFRKNLKHYLDQVVEGSERLIVPRSGGKGVVVMSLDEYNSLVETEYLMSSKAMMKAIREAEKEIAEGSFTRFETGEDMNKYFDNLEKEHLGN